VRVFEARAQALVDRVEQGQGYELPPDQWQRRLIALVDLGPDRFYCLDFYRLSGGRQHWWAFHCQEGAFSTEGISLTKQPGTLAGPEVPYGDPKWLRQQGCSYGTYGWAGPMFAFAHLYNVQRAKHAGPWSAEWKLSTRAGQNGKKPGRDDGLRLRLTVASADDAEVNICDGRSPAGGPYEMKWIMLRREAPAPATTQVISLIEPHFGKPAIRSVRTIELSGADEQGLSAQGCEVQGAEYTDTILASADPTVLRAAEPGLRFAGRFGFYREKDGVPVAMVLVGGTRLAKGGFGITLQSPEYRGKIVRVDRQTETITVAPAPPNPGAMVESQVFITNADRRVAYKVLAAEPDPDGARLRLNWDSRIGIGQSAGATDFQIHTRTPFTLQRFRYYHGARVASAAGGAEYRIIEVRSGRAVFIDPKLHPEAKADRLAREFPTDSWFDIYDYGVGDEVVWPYSVSVVVQSPGVYRLAAPVPVKAELPEGGD